MDTEGKKGSILTKRLSKTLSFFRRDSKESIKSVSSDGSTESKEAWTQQSEINPVIAKSSSRSSLFSRSSKSDLLAQVKTFVDPESAAEKFFEEAKENQIMAKGIAHNLFLKPSDKITVDDCLKARQSSARTVRQAYLMSESGYYLQHVDGGKAILKEEGQKSVGFEDLVTRGLRNRTRLIADSPKEIEVLQAAYIAVRFGGASKEDILKSLESGEVLDKYKPRNLVKSEGLKEYGIIDRGNFSSHTMDGDKEVQSVVKAPASNALAAILPTLRSDIQIGASAPFQPIGEKQQDGHIVDISSGTFGASFTNIGGQFYRDKEGRYCNLIMDGEETMLPGSKAPEGRDIAAHDFRAIENPFGITGNRKFKKLEEGIDEVLYIPGKDLRVTTDLTKELLIEAVEKAPDWMFGRQLESRQVVQEEIEGYLGELFNTPIKNQDPTKFEAKDHSLTVTRSRSTGDIDVGNTLKGFALSNLAPILKRRSEIEIFNRNVGSSDFYPDSGCSSLESIPSSIEEEGERKNISSRDVGDEGSPDSELFSEETDISDLLEDLADIDTSSLNGSSIEDAEKVSPPEKEKSASISENTKITRF